MQQTLATPSFDPEKEYRAIETTLLETTTGRWFLAEHGRRSRRLDSAALEDAIGKLKDSIRQPPAILQQLQAEIGELRLFLAQTREDIMAKQAAAVTALKASGEGAKGDAAKPKSESADASPISAIMRAAEDMHELAWGLQSREMHPEACEAIGRQAAMISAMAMQQAAISDRVLKLAAVLDTAGSRVAAVLETLAHELEMDKAMDERAA